MDGPRNGVFWTPNALSASFKAAEAAGGDLNWKCIGAFGLQEGGLQEEMGEYL